MIQMQQDQIYPAPYLADAVPLSEDKLQELLQNDVDNLPLNFALGNFYFFSRRYDEAKTIYRKILDFEPQNAEVRYNLAAACEALPCLANTTYPNDQGPLFAPTESIPHRLFAER